MNCKRNYPWYKEWQQAYADNDFTNIAIHTPELSNERGEKAVAGDADRQGLDYPIVVDDGKQLWSAWGNSMWPSTYLIDKEGYVRYWWAGELNWENTGINKVFGERIGELLAEK
ncbi:redoxin family protein [Planctomycetota bacterium]